MALFSRRPKGTPDEPDAPEAPVTEDAVAPDEHVPVEEEAEVAASVDISVTSYRGLGAQTRAATPAPPAPPAPPARAEAPKQTETVAGLRDNVLVREALAGLPETPSSQDLLNVARQLLQGHLFLRVKGDARTLLAEGKELPLAMASVGDRNLALAYSSGAALQASVRADGDVDTSAMGQPVLVVIRHVLAGSYEGLIVDHASAPARAIFPRALLEKIVEKLDETLTIKTLLAEERTDATRAAVAEALTRVPFWVAVGRGEGDRPGIAEARGTDGSRFLEVYSHPLEVAAMGRADQHAPLTGAQLAVALRGDEGLTGIVVDPRGPWIQLTRGDLAPVIALAG
jgi:hypothetical protein